jgi:omega-hydroxy-beta-dihydromenaquinone-9 sulfotransferase
MTAGTYFIEIAMWRDALLQRFGGGGFAGITVGRWLRVLRDNHFAVDRPYWLKAAMITLASIPNTLLGAWEDLWYRRTVRDTKIDPPLFILGIWRSGTTHLHNLLAQDDRFAFPNTYQACFAHSFLSSESVNAWIVDFLLPKRRPMDSMTMGVAEPQEDEFAIGTLTGRAFPMAWAFPRHAGFYNRYLTLRGASESDVAEWQAALMWFVQKLSFKFGKPLVLKSPGHTCRIKRLLELFPEARFIHIHRNPFHVFRSTQHMIRSVTPLWALQRPDYSDLDDRTIQQYKEVYDAFFEERRLIPRDRFHEVCFESLETDPIGQMRGIYEALALPDFPVAEPAIQRYVESLGSYRKNAFLEIPFELKTRIEREWRRCFEEWGYSISEA